MLIVRSRNEDSDNDNLKVQDSLHVIESHVLQERKIGTFGAVSLVVNKIVGAGYVVSSVTPEFAVANLYQGYFQLQQPFISSAEVLAWL